MIAGNNLHPLSSDDINKIDEFRKAKQTAVLAILFSDIVNSTYAAEKYGEQAYSKIRHIHDELFIRIMTQDNAGRIIKEIGDSFLCVFSEPSTAVLRAIEFQNAIYSNADNLRIDDFSLKVKIGIHIGQVAVENNFALDIFGRHVNRASRIQSIAKGGQILTSQSVWENAVGWLKGHDDKNIKWISYGKTKLKGIKESVDIYCFYSAITGKPPLPETIKINKQRRTILLVAVLFAIVAISFFAFRKIGQIKQDAIIASQLPSKKVYYVQFDFSTLLKNSLDKNAKIDIDTLDLKDKLLSQVIAVLYPDSVIEELDLKESLSRKGIFYTRHMKDNSLDGRYFQDTLKVSGIIDIRPSELLSQIDTGISKNSFGFRKHVSQGSKLNDSILIRINVQLFSKYGVKGKDGYHWESMNNIRNDFRNDLQDAIMSFKADIIQGLVRNCSDSFSSLN